MITNRRALAGLLAAALLACGCSRSKGEGPVELADAGPDAEAADAASAASAAAPAAPEGSARATAPSSSAAEAAPERKEESPAPPPGYVVMKVLDVVPTPHGNAVLLADEAEEKIVPIFVGGTEALSIELRLETKRYERPLTHDLLDDLVGKLGGELVKVQVDEIRGTVFVGSVFVRQAGKIISVDSRPSDAIALALGKRAPIFMALKVIDVSAVKKRDLAPDPSQPDRVRVPKTSADPMFL